MKIGIISLFAEVHNSEHIIQSTNTILIPLKKEFDIDEITISDIHQVDFPIVFIRTGGAEHGFKHIFPQLLASGKPITLLSSHTHNSLPASLEILYWLTKNGIQNSLVLHGSIDSIIEKIKKRFRHIEIAQSLKKMNIGVIGNPSDWLIASDVNYEAVHRKWGIKFTNIPLEEVIADIPLFSDTRVNEVLSTFPSPTFIDGPGQKDIIMATKIYLALKRVVAEHQLTALTLRCFDLLKPLNNTGCLALAKLNDDGFPAGCEGDIPALFTMVMNNLLTGAPSFMANPSQIGDDGIIFAHCTVPVNMVQTFGYKTHFESGIGIGISGRFSTGNMTVSKINGDALEYFYASQGECVDFEDSPNLCRTQVKLKIPNGYDYFFRSPLGNHHILGRGDYLSSFVELMDYFSLHRVE